MIPFGISKEDILEQVNAEYTAGYNAIRPKRQLHYSRMSLYSNVGEENKIYVRLIYSTMQTLLALYFKDEPQIEFLGRQVGDHNRALNLQRLKDFDYEEMGLDQIRWTTYFNMLRYGVGIEVSDGWDEVTQTPKVRTVNPMCWIPDPHGSYGKKHRFHGFELTCSKSDLMNGTYLDKHLLKSEQEKELEKKIEDIKNRGYSSDQLELETYQQQHREIITDRENGFMHNGDYSIYQHRTTLKDGKKYIITTGNDRTQLLNVQEIKPVLLEEKKDNSKVDLLVNIRYYSPLEGDPMGVCVPDLLEDKQKMKQLFMNLNKIKAENEAYGDIFFYDENVVENINDLKVPTIGPKYVSADLSRGNTPMMEVQKSRVKQDAYNMPQILSQQGFEDIGLDEASLGTSPSGSRTATEHQRVQRNANLRLDLGLRLDKYAEKNFWKYLWYRMYVEFFKPSSNKIVYLNNGVGQKPVDIYRDDFISSSDINIKVKSSIEEEERKSKESAMFTANLQLVLNNPNASEASKNYAMREALRLSGIDEEKISIMIPKTREELEAELYLELIDRGEDVGEIVDMNEDHMAYIIVYQQAIDGPAKTKAIEARKEALRRSGQDVNIPGARGDSNTQSQMVSNMISQSSSPTQGTPSLQDIR